MGASRRGLSEGDEVKIPRYGPAPAVPPVVSRPTRPTSTSAAPPAIDGHGSADTRQWYYFLLELRTALAAGVSFVEAVTLVGQNTKNRSIRRATSGVLVRLADGKSIADALAAATVIPPLVRNVILAGIRGGNLPDALDNLVSHYLWLLELRSLILRVIMYPASLVVLGAAVMVFRDTTIASMTGAMGTTQALVAYSMRYFLPILLGAGAAVILAWVISTAWIKPLFDRVVLTAPLVGKLVHRFAIARFLRELSALIEAGMPITSAWIYAGQAAGNGSVSAKLQNGLRYLQDGESLETALRHTQQFPREVLTMAATSSVSGSGPGLLRRYAQWVEDDMKSRLRMSTKVVGFICLPFIALGYFVNPLFLAVLAVLLMFARRIV